MKLSARPRSSLFPVWLLGGLVLALVAGQRERATDTASYVFAKNAMVSMRDGRIVTAQTWKAHPEFYREVFASIGA